MSIMQHPRNPGGGGLVRWRPRLHSLRQNGRFSRPLAAAGTTAALVGGGAAAVIALGGVVVVGVGALAIGAAAAGSYWFWAKRKAIWVHVLVDNDDAVISLALPIPLSLLRLGLELSPVPDDAVDTARLILEDPELLDALHKDAIEVVLDSDGNHVEVAIGPRRKRWRALQFKPVRSFSQTIVKTKPLSNLEEITHV